MGRHGVRVWQAVAAVWVAGVVCVQRVAADDFWYRDFNSTAGLAFNGAAGTSTCADGSQYHYSVVYGVNDVADAGSTPDVLELAGGALATTHIDSIPSAAAAADVSRRLASFPHRSRTATSPTAPCPARLRCVHVVCPAGSRVVVPLCNHPSSVLPPHPPLAAG